MIQPTREPNRPDSSQPVIHPFTGVVTSAAGLLGDVVELGELQVALAKEDARQAFRGSVMPVVALAVGVIGFVSGLPLLGLGLASWLVESQGWDAWKAQLCTGLLLIVIATLSVVLGYFGIKASLRSFSRSSNELANNVAWLKSLIQNQNNSQGVN